jgi:hypothetical protein
VITTTNLQQRPSARISFTSLLPNSRLESRKASLAGQVGVTAGAMQSRGPLFVHPIGIGPRLW